MTFIFKSALILGSATFSQFVFADALTATCNRTFPTHLNVSYDMIVSDDWKSVSASVVGPSSYLPKNFNLPCQKLEGNAFKCEEITMKNGVGHSIVFKRTQDDKMTLTGVSSGIIFWKEGYECIQTFD